MKKELIKLGDKLAWDGQTANVGVTVIDTSMIGNTVGIADGGITHIVDARELAPFPTPIVAEEPKVRYAHADYCETAPVPCVAPTDIPDIKISYDEKVQSLFIVINDKSTICVPNLLPKVKDEIGISHKHTDDNYNQEIGNALAYYRSSCNEKRVSKKILRKMPFPLFL